jgi:hypothetical protein
VGAGTRYRFTVVTTPNDRGHPDDPVPLDEARDHLETVLRAFNIKVESIKAEVTPCPINPYSHYIVGCACGKPKPEVRFEDWECTRCGRIHDKNRDANAPGQKEDE